MFKSLLLVIAMLSSTIAFAHGSSHPTHYSYQRVGFDLVETKERSGKSTIHVYNNYYAPERIKARELAEIKRKKINRILSNVMIIPGLIFFGFVLYFCFWVIRDTIRIDKEADGEKTDSKN